MNDIRLTKVQAALLEAAEEAAAMAGTRGMLSEALLRRISGHFFRENLVSAAIRELARARRLELLPDGRYRVNIWPTDRMGGPLPGYEPEALSTGALVAMVRETESGGVADISPTTTEQARAEPIKLTSQWTRRFRLLANHRLAETWYGGALPPELSSAVVTVNQADPRFFLSLRYKLATERLMETERIPGRQNLRSWQVSRRGIESYVRHGIGPSLALPEVETIGASLGLLPLSSDVR